MPIKYDNTIITINDKYAYCYRLLELLRLEFNTGNITKEQHHKLENEVIKDLLKYRKLVRTDITNKAKLTDVSL